MASVRREQELAPCQSETCLASPKTDPLQAKAEPISDAGGPAVITYLRKGKKHCTAPVRERSEKMREKQPCRHQDK